MALGSEAPLAAGLALRGRAGLRRIDLLRSRRPARAGPRRRPAPRGPAHALPDAGDRAGPPRPRAARPDPERSRADRPPRVAGFDRATRLRGTWRRAGCR